MESYTDMDGKNYVTRYPLKERLLEKVSWINSTHCRVQQCQFHVLLVNRLCCFDIVPSDITRYGSYLIGITIYNTYVYTCMCYIHICIYIRYLFINIFIHSLVDCPKEGILLLLTLRETVNPDKRVYLRM
jgi:hypothetical protein